MFSPHWCDGWISSCCNRLFLRHLQTLYTFSTGLFFKHKRGKQTPFNRTRFLISCQLPFAKGLSLLILLLFAHVFIGDDVKKLPHVWPWRRARPLLARGLFYFLPRTLAAVACKREKRGALAGPLDITSPANDSNHARFATTLMCGQHCWRQTQYTDSL